MRLRSSKWGDCILDDLGGPKMHHMYPCKREAEGHLTGRGGDEAARDLKMLAVRTGVAPSQATECQQPPETRRGKEPALPRASGGTHTLISAQ